MSQQLREFAGVCWSVIGMIIVAVSFTICWIMANDEQRARFKALWTGAQERATSREK